MDLSVVGSDTASGFASNCIEAFAKQMKKEIGLDHGDFNTPGFVNVAIVIREIVYPARVYFHDNDLIYKMAVFIVDSLNDVVERLQKTSGLNFFPEDKESCIHEFTLLRTDVLRYVRYCEKQRPELKSVKPKRSKKS